MASLFSDNPSSLFGKGTTAVGDLFHEDENNEDESSLFHPRKPENEDENGLPELPTFSSGQKTSKDPPKTEEKPPEPEKPKQKKKSKEKKRVQKFIVQKKEVQAPDPMKKALTHFQTSINQQFDSINRVIEDLKPPDQVQGAVLPNDQILRQIQDAVNFADEKDGILMTEQYQIDRINAGEFENDERKLLRAKIEELNSQIEEETAKTNELEQNIALMQEQYGQMVDENEQLEPNSQNSQTRLRNVIKRDIERANLEYANHKTTTEKLMADESDQIKILKEQTEKFASNNELFKDFKYTSPEDYEKARNDFKEEANKAINTLIDGVMAIFENGVKPKLQYGGDTVVAAMKSSLWKIGKTITDLGVNFDIDDDEEIVFEPLEEEEENEGFDGEAEEEEEEEQDEDQ